MTEKHKCHFLPAYSCHGAETHIPPPSQGYRIPPARCRAAGCLPADGPNGFPAPDSSRRPQVPRRTALGVCAPRGSCAVLPEQLHGYALHLRPSQKPGAYCLSLHNYCARYSSAVPFRLLADRSYPHSAVYAPHTSVPAACRFFCHAPVHFPDVVSHSSVLPDCSRYGCRMSGCCVSPRTDCHSSVAEAPVCPPRMRYLLYLCLRRLFHPAGASPRSVLPFLR